MHLEHVNLTVADLDRSIAFYRELLDLEVRWQGTLDSGRRAAHVGDERSYLALFEAGEPGTATNDYEKPGLNHVGFVVEDLGEAKRRLAKLGARVHSEADYEPGLRAYFFDPSGVEVELVEYPAAS